MAAVLVFGIRGLLRGTVAQVFAALGLITGLWAAGWVLHWVGGYWAGARPVVMFVALRWLVAVLAGLALASFFQWWGSQLRTAVQSGPLGWFDRLVGLAIGVCLGVAILAFVLMAALSVARPREIAGTIAHARVAAPLMNGAARACALGQHYFPGGHWLEQRFAAAESRVRKEQKRTSRSTS